MVKFTNGSRYYDTVISKISTILNLPSQGISTVAEELRSKDGPLGEDLGMRKVNLAGKQRQQGPCFAALIKYILIEDLDRFKRTLCLTADEIQKIEAASFDSIQHYVLSLQQQQEQNSCMMYMKRLEPFLSSMKVYVEVVTRFGLFINNSHVVSYIWVSSNVIPSKH